jgi:hypothetical protein
MEPPVLRIVRLERIESETRMVTREPTGHKEMLRRLAVP